MHRAAAEYYRSRGIPERLEEALNVIYLRGPREDVYGELVNFLTRHCAAPVICGVQGRKVLDGSGLPALEVQVRCTVRNIEKTVSSVTVAASSDSPQLVSSEANEKERVKSVDVAIEWIKRDLSPLITGISPSDQTSIDRLLREYFKPKREEARERMKSAQDVSPSPTTSTPTSSPKPGKKKSSAKGKKTVVVEKPIPPKEPMEPTIWGSPAIRAISLAVAKSSAALSDTPLYLYIASLKDEQPPAEFTMPSPMISLLSYGKASSGKLNLMKEVIVIPGPGRSLQEPVSPLGCLVLGCDRIDQPLELMGEACEHLGLELGTDLHLALNCAAHDLMDYNKGRYEVLSGTYKTPDEMVDIYADLIRRFPSVIALLDPLRREDTAQWQSLANTLTGKCYLISDVSCKPISWLLEENLNVPLSSGAVIRHSHEASVCDLLDVSRHIQGRNGLLVLGCCDEEPCDDSLADLVSGLLEQRCSFSIYVMSPRLNPLSSLQAVGLGAQFVKLGGLLRGERTTKYNRLLAIEEALRLGGALGMTHYISGIIYWIQSV
uniref:phosphopyruvate hydratase n=1 Tax=Leptobrachium leishanense TaxID=445787 RepID=A0A8C5Q3W3_9ANUR